VGSLPTDAARLLTRASELIKQATLNNIDETNDDHMEYAELATCAQVEYWIDNQESVSTSPGYKSLKLGEFAVTFNNDSSDGSVNRNQLASRARNYLNDGGLLYRGVKLNYADTDDLTN